MSSTAIEVTDLRKSYGGPPVLRGLTFEVGAREIFGIAGANGAGKTTAVEILQGLRSRDAGHVEVLGLDPARDRARLRPLIGAQLQSSALPDRLRVGEALRLFAGLAGDVVSWRALADTWRLTPLLRKSFGSLSGGQRQRLFLALALVNDPRLVFLDELTQGLDPAARRETWTLVERARDQGATVVLVTHDMDEAERLCDRVAIVDHGRVIALGTPRDLIASLGGDQVVEFVLNPVGTDGHVSEEVLQRLEGVRAARHIGGDAGDAWELHVSELHRTVPALLAELSRRDLHLAELRTHSATLEDVFVHLTGRQLRDE
jgi:ABC-2 type transport system ATP-binding protein